MVGYDSVSATRHGSPVLDMGTKDPSLSAQLLEALRFALAVNPWHVDPWFTMALQLLLPQ